MINSLRRGAAVVAATTVLLMVPPGGPALAQMPSQVPLTTAKVEAVIASYPVVQQTADDLRAQYGDVGGGASDPASGWGAWMAVSAAHGALNGVVQGYGFAGFQEWVGTVTSVVMAHAFAAEGGAGDGQMAEALAQIENNPNLTAAQKEMMLQQIQASMGALAMMRPSQENIEAVAPYAAELEALFED